MADRVAIVTDSLGCLTKEMVAQYGIRIVPAKICCGDKLYRDWVDITPSQAYKLFLEDPESFKTSPASPTEYFEAYREASKQAKNTLCVTISAKLSAIYNVACVAREQAKTELPHTSIEVLDSRMAVTAEGLVTLAAARAAAEGKSFSEVIKVAEEMRNRVNFVFLLDTVRYIYRTGRIPRVAARAGSILNIKPILTTSSGVVRLVGVVRNKERGIDRLLKIMRDNMGLSPVHVAVTHAYALDEAERLKERVSSEFNCVELWLTEFSPLLGYACGAGTLGLAYYSEA
ncbi:DegV domain-containing protein [subsurface metagenome]